jgi:transposase-like protein
VPEDEANGKVGSELKIDRMFIQTPTMAKYYAKYHDVVFMDATYNTNKHNLALAIISGVSSEGKNIIMGVAFLQRESTEHYRWLLNTLVDFSGGIEPTTFMTDFDSSMCGGIEQTFSKTTHLLCQWHMMQNFKKHFVYLSKRKNACAKMLYNHIMDAIFTDSPKRFQELQDIIF